MKRMGQSSNSLNSTASKARPSNQPENFHYFYLISFTHLFWFHNEDYLKGRAGQGKGGPCRAEWTDFKSIVALRDPAKQVQMYNMLLFIIRIIRKVIIKLVFLIN